MHQDYPQAPPKTAENQIRVQKSETLDEFIADGTTPFSRAMDTVTKIATKSGDATLAELLHARTELEKLLNRPDETQFANEALRRVHAGLEKFESHSQTDKFTNQVKEIAEGILYLTSERLLFCGAENTNVSLKKIVDGQFFSDFLKIDKSTGKSDLFSMNAMEARYILALIRALK